MPSSRGKYSKDLVVRTLAARAQHARLADAKEREERLRSRRELGLEAPPATGCAHGNDPHRCAVCKDWTAQRYVWLWRQDG